MSITNWIEGVPSGQSQVGLFPGFGVSTFQEISTGLALEHYWNGIGGGSNLSVGDLLPGGSRAFVAAQSASSAPSQGTGRLFFASDVTRLFAYDSTGTYLVGTAYGSEHLSAVTTGYWARQTGSYASNTQSDATTITFPVPYLGRPVVFVTRLDSGFTAVVVDAAASGVAAFISSWSALGASAGTITIGWEALGIMSSASF